MPKKSKHTEPGFQKWYAAHAKKWNLDPNPDNPEHHYNYRQAYIHDEKADKTGHLSSKYKDEGHPRLVLNGINTKTGKRVSPKK